MEGGGGVVFILNNVWTRILKKFEFFKLFFNHFDVLILKINFKK
jgi:hypothetical protein